MTVEPAEAGPTNNWRTGRSLAICEHCDWRFLLAKNPSQGEQLSRCPHCRQPRMSLLDGEDPDAPPDASPELILLHRIKQEQLQSRLNEFIRGIRFAPSDLTLTNLATRIEPIFFPMWLVDTDVNGRWEAEVGTNYDVVSHQERFGDRSGWQTREVHETRIRWEPRIGSLTRTYNNVAAPALEGYNQFKKSLGSFDLASPKPFEMQYLNDAHLRMPNRRPRDAWPAAVPALQKVAAEECRKAAGADHIRQFRWSPTYQNRHWTLLLLPAFTTYYLDDEAQPQSLLIHGQTGRVFGRRRASPARARKTAGVILVIALLVGLLSLVLGTVGIMVPPLALVGVLGIIAAVLVGVGAVIPPVLARRFNAAQVRHEREQKPF